MAAKQSAKTASKGRFIDAMARVLGIPRRKLERMMLQTTHHSGQVRPNSQRKIRNHAA
jgi:hypothetical protein